MPIEMERQVIERDPIVDLQARVAERLRAQIEQTVSDRLVAVEFSNMEGEERAKFAGSLALVATASFENSDCYDLANRFNRLYASLSIDTYEGKYPNSIVDDLLSVAMEGVEQIEAPDLRGEALVILARSRKTGLNPARRNRAEHLENDLTLD